MVIKMWIWDDFVIFFFVKWDLLRLEKFVIGF